jgi:hypothetical protein
LWKLEKEGKGVNRYCALKKMEGDQCKRHKRNINWFNWIKLNSESLWPRPKTFGNICSWYLYNWNTCIMFTLFTVCLS